MIEPLLALDDAVNIALAPLRHGLLLTTSRFITTMGAEAAALPVAVVASGLLAAGRRGTLVAPMWLTLLGAEATTYGLKYWVGRPRPPTLAGLAAISPSFPSAHATVTVALYGFLALVIAAGLPRRRAMALALAAAAILAIGASRLVLSLHYLSDVLAGYAVGGAWLWAGSRWAMLRMAQCTGQTDQDHVDATPTLQCHDADTGLRLYPVVGYITLIDSLGSARIE